MQAARRVPVDERLPQRTRLRKRGPPSLTARERRGQRKPQPAEHLASSFASTVFSANDLVIVQFNLRGFLSKCVELDAYLQVAGPDIVCLTKKQIGIALQAVLTTTSIASAASWSVFLSVWLVVWCSATSTSGTKGGSSIHRQTR